MDTLEPPQLGPRRFTIERNGQVGVVMVGYKVPEGSHEDWAALTLIQQILGADKTGRLYRALEDKGLASGTFSYAPQLRDPSLCILGVYLTPSATHEQAETILEEELAKLIADGVTEVKGFLEGEDSLATLQAFRDMGVTIEGPNEGFVKIHGVGIRGLQAPRGPLYLGNSGTAMRLFSGLLAAQNFDSELTGDESLSKRPMGRVADPLRAMGAVIETGEGGRPPLKIRGGQTLTGIHYDMPVASAQVKSCLLLAGLYVEGLTSVTEPAPTRDHTERMLEGFGYHVHRDASTSSVAGGGQLTATAIDVPADISSSVFFSGRCKHSSGLGSGPEACGHESHQNRGY